MIKFFTPTSYNQSRIHPIFQKDNWAAAVYKIQDIPERKGHSDKRLERTDPVRIQSDAWIFDFRIQKSFRDIR